MLTAQCPPPSFGVNVPTRAAVSTAPCRHEEHDLNNVNAETSGTPRVSSQRLRGVGLSSFEPCGIVGCRLVILPRFDRTLKS